MSVRLPYQWRTRCDEDEDVVRFHCIWMLLLAYPVEPTGYKRYSFKILQKKRTSMQWRLCCLRQNWNQAVHTEQYFAHFLVMAKWSVLNQWSFQHNCIRKRFITQSFLKRFMLWPSTGHKMNNTFQSVVIHNICWFHICSTIDSLFLFIKNIGHCQSHSFLSVYCH